jgi:hypothetical protein
MSSIASDYAVLSGGGIAFYYGYEVTDGEDGEWCFQATTKHGKITIPFSKLGLSASSRFECAECLMRGIEIILERGLLMTPSMFKEKQNGAA